MYEGIWYPHILQRGGGGGGQKPPYDLKNADSTNFNFSRPLGGPSMRSRKLLELMI